MRRLRLTATVMAIWLCGLVSLEAADSGLELETPAEAEARLGKLIDQQYRAAQRLKLDGQARDWRSLTVRQQSRAQAEQQADLDPGLDIQAVGVAPLERGLFVMVAARAAMDRYNGSTWLTIDCVDEEDFDFGVGICFTKDHLIDVYLRDMDNPRVPNGDIKAVQKDVLEVFIPWTALEGAIPEADRHRHGWHDHELREWVRVRARSWNHRSKPSHEADRGLSVACPLLRKGGGSFDQPLREYEGEPLDVAMPLAGEWYISQGAHGYFSHSKKWAWDLVICDAAHRRHAEAERRPAPEKYFGYGGQLLACADGVVTKVIDGNPDAAPGPAVKGGKANSLSIEMANGHVAQYAHIKKGSFLVEKGDRVAMGDPVALVGNSGYTTNPHLHFQVPHAGAHLPTAWTAVRVRLNNMPDDPWQRLLTRWEPRDGFFISRVSEDVDAESPRGK